MVPRAENFDDFDRQLWNPETEDIHVFHDEQDPEHAVLDPDALLEKDAPSDAPSSSHAVSLPQNCCPWAAY